MSRKFLLTAVLLFYSASVVARQKLTIYTHTTLGRQLAPIAAHTFTPRYNCQIEWVMVGTATAILNLLRLEGSNHRADLLVGLDHFLLFAARHSNLIAPHTVDTRALMLPGGWNDPYGLPFCYGYLTFIYHRQRISTPPRSLKVLVEHSPSHKVIYPDPRTSTLGLNFLAWMQQVYGTPLSAIWQQLSKKTVTVTKSWSEAYGLFLRGEADFVLSYTTSPLYHQIVQQDTSYAAAKFDEGHPIQVEVAVKVASSQQQQLADQFMHWLISEEVQRSLPQQYWMYPVIDIPLPVPFNDSKPAHLPLTQELNRGQQDQWIAQWEDNITPH